MDKILDEYSKRVQNVTNVAIARVSRDCVRKLRSDSPRKSGDYARGWEAKKMTPKNGGKIAEVVVHNKTDYQLTHLLENRHEIVNRDHSGERRSYGYTTPGHGQVVHIWPVEKWANEELPDVIERELEK
jgi:hypothetical protein